MRNDVRKVKDVMTKEVIFMISPLSSVQEAAMIMRKSDIGCLVVVDQGRPVGIVTERDLVREITARSLDPTRLPVMQIMSRPLITIKPDMTLTEASKTMIKSNIRRLVVEDDGRLVGVVTATDLARDLCRTKGDTILAAIARRPRIEITSSQQQST